MLLRKIKRNLSNSGYYSAFIFFISFYIIWKLEVCDCKSMELRNIHPREFEQSITRKTRILPIIREVFPRISQAKISDKEHANSSQLHSQKPKQIIERKKRSPTEKESRNSMGAIALAVIKNLLANAAANNKNSDKDKEKDKNPLSITGSTSDIPNALNKFITEKAKAFVKKATSFVKKFRECITLLPFSIDRSCLKR